MLDRPLTLHDAPRGRVADVGLTAELATREREDRPVRVGIIGIGQMGTDLVTQIGMMRGITVAAIADRSGGKRAADAFRIAGEGAGEFRTVGKAGEIASAIEAGVTAVHEDARAVCDCGLIDVVIDATGRPSAGAEIGLYAMRQGRNLVMMNVEADVTVGPILHRTARENGVVYSVGSGDEPSSVMELIEFVTALGYPVVAAGKGKNNPLNPDAVPDDYRQEAEERNMNPRMLVEFVDGSKTMVEMTAIANATGLVPDIPGMHGPEATIETLPNVLCPIEDGGVLSKKGCVDFTLGGGIDPGVFVVAEMAHPRLRERMNDLKLGPGPYYAFYRPYHLTSLEVPLTAARVALRGKPDMVPLPEPVAEVCARAKRDHQVGETLDSIGETSYRSWAMTVEDARAERARPVGILEGGRVTAPIRKGDLFTAANCEPPEGSAIAALRAEQDRVLGL